MKVLIKDLSRDHKVNPDQLLCFAVEYHNKYDVFDYEDDIWQAKTSTWYSDKLVKDFKYANRKGHDWREKVNEDNSPNTPIEANTEYATLNTQLTTFNQQINALLVKKNQVEQRMARIMQTYANSQKNQKNQQSTQATQPKQTGTVNTAGAPVAAATGSPATPKVEAYPDILHVNVVDERMDWEDSAVKANWYNRAKEEPKEEPRKPRAKRMDWKRREKIMELEGEISYLHREVENIIADYKAPSYRGIEGEIENFWGEVGHEGAEILNSGYYKNDKEKIEALKDVGVEHPEEILGNYYYYFPEFNPSKEKGRKQAEKEVAKIHTKIDKIQAKIDKWEEMYESLNEGLPRITRSKWVDEVGIELQNMSQFTSEHILDLMHKYEITLNYMYMEGETSRNAAKFILSNNTPEHWKGINETKFNAKSTGSNEYRELKNYMDAENISYIENEDETTIDFDEDELADEWKDQLDDIGLEPVESEETSDDILTVSDDDDDITSEDEKIDEEKVFYVKIDDEAEEFIGKIYKLFDDGEWRSKLVDGESETFEKINFDPDYDEFDIISFLRDNYADAELLSEDEYNKYIEDSKEEIKESSHNHNIPTLDEYFQGKEI
jgi:hypothetical protein